MPGAHDMAEFSIYRTVVAPDMIVQHFRQHSVSDSNGKQKYNKSHILNMPITVQNMWAHNCNLDKTLRGHLAGLKSMIVDSAQPTKHSVPFPRVRLPLE